jgi:hypothetical protein
MEAKTHASSLDLTFTNTGSGAIDLERRVSGPVAIYDGLTVDIVDTLSSKLPPRTLKFTLPRASSISPDVSRVPAGGSVTEAIDLQAWAVRAGSPLHPGTYSVTARWDASRSDGERFVATAQTKLVIAAAVGRHGSAPAACATSDSTDLRLVAYQPGPAATVELGIHNAGATTLCVQALHRGCIISDTRATVVLDPTSGAMRVLHTVAPACFRTGLAALVELPPGATHWETLDLVELAGGTLRAGTYNVAITVDAPERPGRWHGLLATQLRFAAP